MRQDPSHRTELDWLKRRVKALEQTSLYTDVGLVSQLRNFELEELKELLDFGVVGFCAHLMPPFQQDLRWLMRHEFEEVLRKIHKIGRKILVAVNCDEGLGRELAVASPYRVRKIEDRLLHGVDIDLSLTKDAYAGGDVDSMIKAVADVEVSDSMSDMDSLEEDGEKNSPMIKRNEPTLHLTPNGKLVNWHIESILLF